MARAGSTGTVVLSPVTGTVQMFLVENDLQVKKGEQLIAIESMKSFFYGIAPCDGVVQITCKLGQTVKRGAVLCRIL